MQSEHFESEEKQLIDSPPTIENVAGTFPSTPFSQPYPEKTSHFPPADSFFISTIFLLHFQSISGVEDSFIGSVTWPVGRKIRRPGATASLPTSRITSASIAPRGFSVHSRLRGACSSGGHSQPNIFAPSAMLESCAPSFVSCSRFTISNGCS